MKTRIEELKEKLQIEKKKIASLELEIKMLQEQSKYHKSKWMELWACNIKISTINGLYFSKKYLIFAALIETCKEWNKIDGFEPDRNSDKEKVCICLAENKVQVVFATIVLRPLCFENTQTAQLFLDTYRTELEQVKDLI